MNSNLLRGFLAGFISFPVAMILVAIVLRLS